MKRSRIHLPTSLALAVALVPFAVLAQPPHEPPVDPATPLDTAPPTVPADPVDRADPATPIDPRDVQDPIDPAHPWTPPESTQDPTAAFPAEPVPTGDPSDRQAPTTGDAVRRGSEGQPATISSHVPDSVVGDYRIDFDALDTNGDGYISRDEARGNDVLTSEFHVVDSNGDGRLSREELAGWLR